MSRPMPTSYSPSSQNDIPSIVFAGPVQQVLGGPYQVPNTHGTSYPVTAADPYDTQRADGVGRAQPRRRPRRDELFGTRNGNEQTSYAFSEQLVGRPSQRIFSSTGKPDPKYSRTQDQDSILISPEEAAGTSQTSTSGSRFPGKIFEILQTIRSSVKSQTARIRTLKSQVSLVSPLSKSNSASVALKDPSPTYNDPSVDVGHTIYPASNDDESTRGTHDTRRRFAGLSKSFLSACRSKSAFLRSSHSGTERRTSTPSSEIYHENPRSPSEIAPVTRGVLPEYQQSSAHYRRSTDSSSSIYGDQPSDDGSIHSLRDALTFEESATNPQLLASHRPDRPDYSEPELRSRDTLRLPI
ncbi:uncharacterized protein IL334_003611 [Kwoniella shivajii]|uniref:Uncharacterized protein n=1 Tax=Kwoniella shivajii TaxID=564305 RepID=A0ABZ1CY27_9TREE|nr:hypothetical protein IL334_003611 [Kwoniella shivajii]